LSILFILSFVLIPPKRKIHHTWWWIWYATFSFWIINPMFS
jgi:hypothetical protein